MVVLVKPRHRDLHASANLNISREEFSLHVKAPAGELGRALKIVADAVITAEPQEKAYRRLRLNSERGLAEAMLKPELLPGIGNVKGYQSSYLLRREMSGGEVEFITIMLFDSLDSIRQVAGTDYETAVIPAERRQHLAHFDAKATHYEVAAIHAK